MVRTIVSLAEVSSSSRTVKVSVIVVLAATDGAVTSGAAELMLSKVTTGVSGYCDHAYVIRSLSGSEPDPCRVTELPSSTFRSRPASAVGALLVPSRTVMSSILQLLSFSNTEVPDAVTLAL